MKLYSTLGLLFLTLYCAFCTAQQNPNQIPTKALKLKEIQEDFTILKGALSTDYPSANRYITKDSVNSLWSLWENQLKPMNEREFFNLIGEITHSFHDEHLIPNISQSFLKNPNRRFLPFTLNVASNEAWIRKIHPEVQNLKQGDKLISINGISIKDIIEEISIRMHHDGHIKTFIERHMEDFSPTQSFNYFDMWYSLIYDDGVSHFDLEVVKDMDTTKLLVKSLSRKDYIDFYWSRMPREAPAKFKILQDSIAYLEVSSFHGWYRKKHKQNFKTIFEKTFTDLNDQNIKTLILDLRRCEGGDDSNKLLLQYLIDQPFTVIKNMYTTFSGSPKYLAYYDDPSLSIKPKLLQKIDDNWFGISDEARKKIPGLTPLKPKNNVFKGKLLVLTSGATGSAASVVSAMLEKYTNAFFIGEETGGTTNGPTALLVPFLMLPNSNIRIEVPLVQIHLNADNSNGRGVIPDLKVSKLDYPADKLIAYILDKY